MRILSLLFAISVTFGSALAEEPAFPPLPTAVSSFGAAVDGGFLYVYGGHAGATHTYSTETASGKFRRLDLAKPAKGWEELAGGTPLQGEIPTNGSKNSALPALAAALLTEEPVTLKRIPRVRDIRTMQRLLVDIGSKVDVNGQTEIRTFDANTLKPAGSLRLTTEP